jgi:hypothetical protein
MFLFCGPPQRQLTEVTFRELDLTSLPRVVACLLSEDVSNIGVLVSVLTSLHDRSFSVSYMLDYMSRFESGPGRMAYIIVMVRFLLNLLFQVCSCTCVIPTL